MDIRFESTRSGGSIFLKAFALVLLGLGVIFFVTHVLVPPHQEEIKPVAIPTLGGIVIGQTIETAQEGFSLAGEIASQQVEGFNLQAQQDLAILMYDDLPVLPEEPFSVIAERVRDAIQQDDPDMLTWDHSRIIDAEIMDMLFNSDGSPKEGVAVRWHGYFARWLMLYRPEWLSSQSANTEPAVTYWTVYLQLRAHVPQEQMPGAAPWEWNNTRPNWLD